MLLVIALTTSAVSSMVLAEPAFVGVGNRSQGQAFTFLHRETCFAVLPNHVSPRQKFSLRAGDPPRTGTGTMTPRRFTAADFALAIVDGAMANGCSPTWDSLPDNLGPLLPDGGAATITTIRSSGVEERVAVIMSPVTYEHIGVMPVDSKLRGLLGQGRSGSLLSVGNQPVGIVIERPDSNNQGELRVLRMDAIKARLNRYLSTAQPIVSKQNTAQSTGTGVAFDVVSWTVEPSDPDNAPTQLEQADGNPYLAVSTQRTPRLRLRIVGVNGGIVRGVQLSSEADDTYAIPKTIRLYAPRGPNDGSPRRLATGRVGPDGEGTIAIRARRLRWLDVEVIDTWDPSKPVRIDILRISGSE